MSGNVMNTISRSEPAEGPVSTGLRAGALSLHLISFSGAARQREKGRQCTARRLLRAFWAEMVQACAWISQGDVT